MSIDDIELEEGFVPTIKKPIFRDRGPFNNVGITHSIVYNIVSKRFVPGYTINDINAFMGWLIDYDENTDLVDVLYRGFLMKDPLRFSLGLKPYYIQTNIEESFKHAAESIIEKMPRIKKLKRLNLKMITREHALFIYHNLEDIINYYQNLYGYEKAQIFKAQLTTSPFYINDNGIIKLYDIQTNELKIPDLESEGFFLAYFTFMNETN